MSEITSARIGGLNRFSTRPPSYASFWSRSEEMPLALTIQGAVAQPLGNPQHKQQAAKRDAHESHDQGQPTAIRAGTGPGHSAENRFKQDDSQDTGADDPPSSF